MQGEKTVSPYKIEFRASQRVLYLEHSVDDEVDKSLREFGTDLDGILGEMEERGLVREVLGR